MLNSFVSRTTVSTIGLLIGLAVLTSWTPGASAQDGERLNGFDLSNLSVQRELLVQGGPPRDGIPALTDPKFIAAKKAHFLKPGDRVLGIQLEGIAKAYPLSILNMHEIVNDRFGKKYVLVTYCPLCFTGMAFDAMINGKRQLFGVSGLLFNSDVLIYDRASESLWSQIKRQAVSGPMRGSSLSTYPVSNTTWADWRKRYPDSWVLSHETGHRRDYSEDPYAHYDQSPDVLFPVQFRAKGYHPKERVIGIVIDGAAKAYPVSELSQSKLPVLDRVAGKAIQVSYDDQHLTAEITDEQGQLLDGVMAYWFAWYAFHPETLIYRAKP